MRVRKTFTVDGVHGEFLSWQLPYGPRTEAIFLKPTKTYWKPYRHTAGPTVLSEGQLKTLLNQGKDTFRTESNHPRLGAVGEAIFCRVDSISAQLSCSAGR